MRGYEDERAALLGVVRFKLLHERYVDHYLLVDALEYLVQGPRYKSYHWHAVVSHNFIHKIISNLLHVLMALSVVILRRPRHLLGLIFDHLLDSPNYLG